MNIFDALFQGPQGVQGGYVPALVLPILVAFIVGQANAWCFQLTHRGVSYSRTFTQALVLITMISSLTMCMVRANPIAAFGLIGGMAIIRYRTVVRDTRDTAYILLCLVVGMAAGFGFHAVAVFGTAAANGVSVYLHATGFGSRHASDSLLRFQTAGVTLDGSRLDALLAKYCRRFSVISLDEIPARGPGEESSYQYAYKVRFRDPERVSDFVAALRATDEISVVHVLVEQGDEEVA